LVRDQEAAGSSPATPTTRKALESKDFKAFSYFFRVLAQRENIKAHKKAHNPNMRTPGSLDTP